MTFDERIEALTRRMEALTMNLELLYHTREDDSKKIQLLLVLAERDGENIRALARIAESHERRLSDLEGGPAA